MFYGEIVYNSVLFRGTKYFTTQFYKTPNSDVLGESSNLIFLLNNMVMTHIKNLGKNLMVILANSCPSLVFQLDTTLGATGY